MYKVTNNGQGPLVITDARITLQPGEDAVVSTLTNGLRQARSLGLLAADKVDEKKTEPPTPIPEHPEEPPLPERIVGQEQVPVAAESPPLPAPENTPEHDTATMRVSDAVAYLERETDAQKIMQACRRERRSTVRRAAKIRMGELNAAQ